MILAMVSLVILSACTQLQACTQEARLCPDGSAVGRTGPNCEFPACPENNITNNVTEKCDVVCASGWHLYNDARGCGCEQDNSSLAAKCSSYNGAYDPQYKECAGISKEQCESINGTFNECGSACRHDPTAQVCTMQCVIYCQLK